MYEHHAEEIVDEIDGTPLPPGAGAVGGIPGLFLG
jgi:hypothetical protein